MSFLGQEIKKRLSALGKRKVVVGIPSYNNEGTIAHVVQQAGKGIIEHFDRDGMILNCDGGSTDRTREVFMETDTLSIPKLSFQYEGVPGKGSALIAMVDAAYAVGAQALVFVDSDLRSVTPEWIYRLAKPITDGKASYVTPSYRRHKYDGTITNQICYPLTSVLYGTEVRQPIGGDFGVSRQMMEVYLAEPKETWRGDAARFGIDIWMTTLAINEGQAPVYQAALGAKIHDVKDPGKHLGPMFTQVVGTLFSLMDRYQEKWSAYAQRPVQAPIFGEPVETRVEPLDVDLENLKRKARSGAAKIEAFLRSSLPPEFLAIVDRVLRKGVCDSSDWLRFVFLISKKTQVPSEKEQWMESLIPFYYARVASFVEATLESTEEEAELAIRKQVCLAYTMKGELAEVWK